MSRKPFRNPAVTLIASFILLCITSTSLTATILDKNAPIYDYMSVLHPVVAKQGMVASQEELASKVGLRILQQGGNAVDAAVAVGFALAVTLPRAGNLGGGGFMLIQLTDGKTVALDYREKAPQAVSKNMFLDESGNPDESKSLHSALASGVPGTVAGLLYALATYGTMPLEKVIQPAISLAEYGFPVSRDLAESLEAAKEQMITHPAAAAIFFKPDGSSYEVGERLFQKDLARTLKLISKHGRDGFYKASTAQKIADYMKAEGGLITMADLAAYEPVERVPLEGTYKGYTIKTMPPPSSGGVHVIQMLNMLEHYNLDEAGHNSAMTIHILTEVMKRAYADRAAFLGDPDFVKVPVQGLTSKEYATRLRKKVSLGTATPASQIREGDPYPYESNETTHFTIVDRFGNVVSNTYTLNFSYGSKHVVPGTGVLLNNEMDDFSAKPGVPNAYGLLGGTANAIEPGKRMLSSMTPVIVLKDNKPYLATGSPGGSRIITTVLQILLNVLEFDMNVAEATYARRIHHQWLPDETRIEEGISPDTIRLLRQKGHNVVRREAMGSAQTIMIKDGVLFGSSDPRKPDSLTIGY